MEKSKSENHYKYEQIQPTFMKILFNNFIAGIAWSFGATIGLAIIIAILSLIAKRVDVIPIIGTFVAHIINYVTQNYPHAR